MACCGGVGAAKEATPEVEEIVKQVKAAAEEKTGKTYNDVFEAKQYATQVVNGTNFFIKVHVGNGEHVHLRVHRSLNNEISLHSVQEGKTESDKISHF